MSGVYALLPVTAACTETDTYFANNHSHMAYLGAGRRPLGRAHIELAHLCCDFAHQLRVVPARRAPSASNGLSHEAAKGTQHDDQASGHAKKPVAEQPARAAHQYFSITSAPEDWMSSNTCFNSGSSFSSSSFAFCSGLAVADSRCASTANFLPSVHRHITKHKEYRACAKTARHRDSAQAQLLSDCKTTQGTKLACYR